MFLKISELEDINNEIVDAYNMVRLLQEHLVNDMRYTEHDKAAAICLYRRMPMYQSALNVIEEILRNLDPKSSKLARDMYEECNQGRK